MKKSGYQMIEKMFKIFIIVVFTVLQCANGGYCLPEGAVVDEGAADITIDGNVMNINASDKAIINYSSFNIAENESVIINLPSVDSEILNRVLGDSASSIFGSLSCNGIFILINTNGIHLGSTANIDAASVILSTRGISNSDFLNSNYVFAKLSQDQLDTLLLNEGTINIAQGGFCALIAGAIENNGHIMAKLGKIALAAGDAISLQIDSQGLISVAIDEEAASQVLDFEGNSITDQIKNAGTLEADGGVVILNADSMIGLFEKSINLDGYLKAAAFNERSGAISIIASEDILMTGEAEATDIDILSQGGALYLDGVLDAENTMYLTAPTEAGYIINTGVLEGLNKYVHGYTFISSGPLRGGNIFLDNLDGAAQSISGPIGDNVTDTGTITVTGAITLTANNLIFTAGDTTGVGAFLMNAGTTINSNEGTVYNLTINVADDSTLGAIGNTQALGSLTLGRSAGSGTPSFTTTSATTLTGGLTIGSNTVLKLDGTNAACVLSLAGSASLANNGALQLVNSDAVGDITIQGLGGTFNFTGTDIDFNGQDLTLANVTYNVAMVTDSGTEITLSGALESAFDNVQIFAGSIFNMNANMAITYDDRPETNTLDIDGTFNQGNNTTLALGKYGGPTALNIDADAIFNKGGGTAQVTTSSATSIAANGADLGTLVTNDSTGTGIYTDLTLDSLTVGSGMLALGTVSGMTLTINAGGSITNNGIIIMANSSTIQSSGTTANDRITITGNDINWNTLGDHVLKNVDYQIDMILANNEEVNIGDSNCLFDSITIQSGGILDATNGGAGNYNFDVSGDWSNAGTFTSGTGTVTFNGTDAQAIYASGTGTGKTFYDLVISNTDETVTQDECSLAIDGSLTIAEGAVFYMYLSGLLDITGNLDIDGELIYINRVEVGGNFNNDGVITWQMPGAATFRFDGTGAQVIYAGGTGADQTFSTVEITNTDGSVTVSNENMRISNSLTVDTNTSFTLASGAQVWVDGGTLTLDGTPVYGAQSAIIDHNGATYNYYGGSTGINKSLLVSDFNSTDNVSIKAGKFAQDEAAAAKSLTIDAGATYAMTSGNLDVGGVLASLVINGTFTQGDNTTLTLGVGGPFTMDINGIFNKGGGTASVVAQNATTIQANGANIGNLVVDDMTACYIDENMAADSIVVNNSRYLVIGRESGITLTISSGGSITNNGTINLVNSSTIQSAGTTAEDRITITGNDISWNTLGDHVFKNVDYQIDMTLAADEELNVGDSNCKFDSITIQSGGILDATNGGAGNYSLSVSGDWDNSGTFTTGTGILTFDGTTSYKDSNVTTQDMGTVVVDGAVTLDQAGNGMRASSVTVNNNDSLDISNSTLTLTGSDTPLTNNGTFTTTGSTVDYTGTSATNVAAVAYNNLDLSGAATYTLLGNLTDANAMTGSLTIDDGATLATNNYNITLAGNWDNSGTFTSGEGTVTMTGSSASIIDAASTGFYNLTINTAGTITDNEGVYVDGSLDVTGDFSIALGKVTTIAGNDPSYIIVNNASTISGDGTLMVLNQASPNITFNGTGNITNDFLEFRLTTSYSMLVPALNYKAGRVTFYGGGSTPPPAYTFTIGEGILDIDGDLEIEAVRTFSETPMTILNNAVNNSSILVGGDWIVTETNGIVSYACGTETVTFDGTSAQTIDAGAGNFNNIQISNIDDTVSLVNSTATISGTLTIDDGANFDIAGQDLTVTGAVSNSGTFTLDGNETVSWTNDVLKGTVNYDGTSDYTTTPGNLAAGNNYYNLTFDGTNGQWILNAALDVNNDFTITNGTLNANGKNINVCDDWSNSGTFISSSNTVTFDGSGTQALNSGGDNFFNVEHSGAGILQLDTNNLVAAGTFENSSGTFDANGLTTTVAGLATVSAGEYQASTAQQIFNGGLTVSGGTFSGSTGVIDVNGDLTISSGVFTAPTGTFTISGDFTNDATFTAGSSTVTFDGASGTQELASGSNAFNNLTHSGASTLQLQDSLDINGSITNSAGILDASSYNINVAGDWSNTATFTAGSSTVTFDGTGASTITGNNTFNNFNCSTAGKSLSFGAGQTQTVTGTFSINGTNSSLIKLGSTGTGMWNIAANGLNISYADVSNSNNIRSETIYVGMDTLLDNVSKAHNWSYKGSATDDIGRITENSDTTNNAENMITNQNIKRMSSATPGTHIFMNESGDIINLKYLLYWLDNNQADRWVSGI